MINSRELVILALCITSPVSGAEFEVYPEILSKGAYTALIDYKRTDDKTIKRTQEMKPFHEREYEQPKYNQDEIDAVKQLKREAIAGDALAQCTMAEYYSKGYIVNQDYAKAIEFYRKAIAQGHIDAYYRLGYMHCFIYDSTYKRSEDENHIKIRTPLFRQALRLGHLGAAYELALASMTGMGVKKSYSQAVKLCRLIVNAKGREPGYRASIVASAQNLLGECYEQGRGVEKSPPIAAFWYRRAALQLNSAALKNYSRLLTTGKGVKKDLRLAEYCERLSSSGWQEDILYDSLKIIPYIYRIQSTKDKKRLPLVELPPYPASKPQCIPAPLELIMG